MKLKYGVEGFLKSIEEEKGRVEWQRKSEMQPPVSYDTWDEYVRYLDNLAAEACLLLEFEEDDGDL